MSNLREEYAKFKAGLPATSITYEQWLEQDAITKSRVNEEILSDYRKQLTLKDLFTPENSGETYVKIAKYREAEAEIKELKESKLALKIAFNGKLATEKAAYESRIKELQAQIQLNYCQPCYDKLNKHE